jgi:ferritin-like metal-binding protein YciE
MEKMNNLRDLLQHEIDDLYSAEEQIIAALPAMIDKASNRTLKSSLQQHLKTTEQQKNRLDLVLEKMKEGSEKNNNGKKKGIFGLFSGKHKCKGMEGIIDEGKKILGEDMDPDVKDAAIIASSQKIEHYEICGYGTARSYAAELGLYDIAALLEETLDEEYEADDKLTILAETRVNKEAERGDAKGRTGSSSARSAAGRETSQDSVRRREVEMEAVSRRQTDERSERTGSPAKSSAPKGTGSRNGTGRTAAKKSTGTKAASRGNTSSSRGSSNGSRSRGR